MKINVEIDCTPEEARAFLGLPDVSPMQERLMKEVDEYLDMRLATDPIKPPTLSRSSRS